MKTTSPFEGQAWSHVCGPLLCEALKKSDAEGVKDILDAMSTRISKTDNPFMLEEARARRCAEDFEALLEALGNDELTKTLSFTAWLDIAEYLLKGPLYAFSFVYDENHEKKSAFGRYFMLQEWEKVSLRKKKKLFNLIMTHFFPTHPEVLEHFLKNGRPEKIWQPYFEKARTGYFHSHTVAETQKVLPGYISGFLAVVHKKIKKTSRAPWWDRILKKASSWDFFSAVSHDWFIDVHGLRGIDDCIKILIPLMTEEQLQKAFSLYDQCPLPLRPCLVHLGKYRKTYAVKSALEQNISVAEKTEVKKRRM